MQTISVRKYKNFSEISKGNPEMEDAAINPNNVLSVFQNIFCNNPFMDHRRVSVFISIDKLKDAIYAPEDKLHKSFWAELSTNATRYGSAIKNIKNIYMPYLLVAENPNKFLKLALETRKACLKGKKLSMFKPNGSEEVISIKNEDGSDSSVTNPLDKFYIGLDQVAQFLNFCVMLRQIPTKEGQEIKNIDQIEKLSFDKSVLKEFVNQYKREKTSVQNLIGEENMEAYTTKLKNLRSQYDNYCRAMINKVNGSCDNCVSFSKWISQSGNFIEGYVRMWDNGPWIGVYKDGPNKDKVIDYKDKDIEEKKVKKGYHNGGGITNDKDELTKLLKLDAVLQAEKAINQFIDSKAVDSQTLNWFQNLWNALVEGTWIANKLGWFFEEGKVTLKSNKFIPKLDEFENTTQESSFENTTQESSEEIK